MKVEIIKSFVDKDGKLLNVGDIVEFEDSRSQKAIHMGLAKECQEAKAESIVDKIKPKKKSTVKK